MSCTICKPIIEKQLKDENAIERIDVDYMTESVIVEFDSSLVPADVVTGYNATCAHLDHEKKAGILEWLAANA